MPSYSFGVQSQLERFFFFFNVATATVSFNKLIYSLDGTFRDQIKLSQAIARLVSFMALISNSESSSVSGSPPPPPKKNPPWQMCNNNIAEITRYSYKINNLIRKYLTTSFPYNRMNDHRCTAINLVEDHWSYTTEIEIHRLIFSMLSIYHKSIFFLIYISLQTNICECKFLGVIFLNPYKLTTKHYLTLKGWRTLEESAEQNSSRGS